MKIGDLIHWRMGQFRGYGTIARQEGPTLKLICCVNSEMRIHASDGWAFQHAEANFVNVRYVERWVSMSKLLTQEPIA